VLASVRSSSKRIGLVVICSASSLLGGWLALRGVQIPRLAGEMGKADPGWLAAATAVFAAAIAVRAVRWWTLFPSPRPSLRSTTSATLVGYLFNTLLPARAGEAARLVALRRTTGEPGGRIAGTIVSERIVDTAILVVLFMAASPITARPIFSGRAEAGVALGVGAIAVTVFGAAAISQRNPERVAARVKRLPAAVRPHVHGLIEGLTGWWRGGAAASVAAVALTAVSWLLLGISNWLLMRGFSMHVSFSVALIIALATGLAMIIPSAPASLGVFEATTVLCLRGSPVGHLQAVSYAVALHAMNVIPLLVAGALAAAVVARSARRPAPGNRPQDPLDADVVVLAVDPRTAGAQAAQEFHSAGR
jgi:glycosyltransferase 2 family protein